MPGKKSLAGVLFCCLILGSIATAQQEHGDQQGDAPNLEGLRKLGERIQQDWQDAPEWALMAGDLLSGKPMGPNSGWWKASESRYGWNWLVATFDANGNEILEPDEISHDPYFQRLDRDHNGRLTVGDFEPERSSNNPASRMASQLFYGWDRDSNGKITEDEVTAFFQQADRDQAGFLTIEDLQSFLQGPPPAPPNRDRREVAKEAYRPGQDLLADLDMLMKGEFGSLTSGPNIDDPAPDFTLPLQDDFLPLTPDALSTVTISKLHGKPVVLVFGSFT